MLSGVINNTLLVLEQVTQDKRYDAVTVAGTPASTEGGICDDCAVLPVDGGEDVVYIGELKRPMVQFLVEAQGQPMHPVDAYRLADNAPYGMVTTANNVRNVVEQAFAYLYLKPGRPQPDPSGPFLACKYAYMTNLKHVFFAQRLVRGGKEVLQLSPFYARELDARLAFAYFVQLAMADGDRAVPRAAAAVLVRRAVVQQQRQAAQASSSAGTSAAPPPQSSQSKVGYWVGRKVAGFTLTDTREALGVDALVTLPRQELVARSGKSATYRGTVGGRDLVWRQMDVYKLPKRTEFSEDVLEDMLCRELAAYAHLRPVWRELVPELVYVGNDFGPLWVTTTTYEGESLQAVADRGALTEETRTKAVEALRQLHALGVVHGDPALRNAVWRESDRRVLWVDLEMAHLRREGTGRGSCGGGDEAWQAAAEAELRAFEEALAQVQLPPPAMPPPPTVVPPGFHTGWPCPEPQGT